MIAVTCSQCQSKLSVKEDLAGKSVRCPKCKQALTAPRLLSEEATLPPCPVPQVHDDPTIPPAAAPIVAPASTAPRSNAVNRAAAEDLDAGTRYRVESEIARGGMGAIMRAVDQDIRREVAVKFLLNQAGARQKARFVEEAQVTGQLEHPNIVPIHQLGVHGDGRCFFSMKMVKGRSLAEILKQQGEPGARGEPGASATGGGYTLGRLLNILVSICNALAYAHSRQVIHRDLKPANIMVGDFGEVYVMDWGLAKVLDQKSEVREQKSEIRDQRSEVGVQMSGTLSRDPKGSATVTTNRPQDSDLTQDGAVLGTPSYMPPEQASGDTAAIDQRSDIYSLGAILYEVLTLTPPVGRGGDYLAVLMRVTQGVIDAPEKRSPDRVRKGLIPPELSAVALKALSKEPKNRYQAVEELKRDIELYLEGRSVSAKHDTTWEAFKKLVKRNKGASIGVAVALLVLLTSLGFLVSAWLETGKAYAAYRDQVAKSLPAFVKAAYLAVEQRQFDDAMVQVELALATAPEEPAPRLLKAQLLMIRQDFAKADHELERYLQTLPADAHAKRLRDLCRQAQPDDVNQLLKVAAVFYEQKGYALVDGLLHKYGKDSTEARQFLLKMYRERIEKSWPGKGARLTIDVAGLKLMFDSFNELTDLSPLKGMPLTSLNLFQCPQVRNLSPLQGMPLTTLSCYGTQVADLSPLQGMPLTALDLSKCARVRDLTPLQGMPLTSLNLTGCTQVRDLTPLQGMKLTTLNLTGFDQLRDLKGLEGMPLTSLTLYNCSLVSDLAPLQGLKLISLDLTNCQMPELTPLQGMPLTTLTLYGAKVKDLTPLQGMKLTSLNLSFATQVQDLTPLQGMQLTSLLLNGCSQLRGLNGLQGMQLTKLDLTGCIQLRDLTGLQDMPLSSLTLTGCAQVQDLTPLKGLKLNGLNLTSCTQVRDLTPLQGLKLTFLNLNLCTQLRDLTPLQGMPLSRLVLSNCTQLRALTGLQDMPLSSLDLNGCALVEDLTPLKGMKLNSLDISGCAQLRDLKGIEGMQPTSLILSGCAQLQDLAPLKGMKLTDHLNLTGCTQLRDLTGLRGMPLTRLTLPASAEVRDLTPLQGMKLTYLLLDGCTEVKDLTPLKGMSLANLQLVGCRQVRDLTPLQGMPLTRLNLVGAGVTDLTPLQGMNLQVIHLTPKTISTGIDVLRRMKSLEKISVSPNISLTGLAPEAFWKKYDAGEFK